MDDAVFFELKQIEDCPVRGHIRMIDDVRFVFVGHDPGDTEKVYLAFRNHDGEDTKLALSNEAFDALKYILTEPFKGKRTSFPYKHKSRWKVKK